MPISRIDNEGLTGPIGGRRNLIINGAMQVAQRGTAFSVTNGTAGFAADRWFLANVSGSTQSADNSTTTPAGFSNSFQLDVDNAVSSPASGAYAYIGHKIEAQNLQHLNYGSSSAKQLTLSFYVRSPKTGTHVVELFAQDGSRNVSATYTVNVADTWEEKSITFPADTGGTINNDNGSGIEILFWLMAGSDLSGGGSLNTSWTTNPTTNTRVVGGVNVLDNASNNFYLTGVQLEVGTVATEFEHRSFGEELALCQRYYFAIETTASSQPLAPYGAGVSSTRVDFNYWLPVSMRAAPTVTVARLGLSTPAGSVTNSTGTDYAAGYQGGQHTNIRLGLDVASGLTANNPYFIRNQSGTGQSYIRCDAEL